jgi:hypothetical protein
MSPNFLPGTVGYLLTQMRGVWHDHLELCALDGTPMSEDPYGMVAGGAPFDNLVYVEFDGENYRQSNVTFRGRPLHVRSFTGKLIDGILHFDLLGPNDPGHIGVAAGFDTLIFVSQKIDDSLQRYAEPDFIRLIGSSERTRSTVLYRGGVAVRTLNVRGVKLSPVGDRRHPIDPRGMDGPVHEARSVTTAYQGGTDDK